MIWWAILAVTAALSFACGVKIGKWRGYSDALHETGMWGAEIDGD